LQDPSFLLIRSGIFSDFGYVDHQKNEQNNCQQRGRQENCYTCCFCTGKTLLLEGERKSISTVIPPLKTDISEVILDPYAVIVYSWGI
ncbi:unnamed protein product, partial [Bubo scandiacus]